MKLVILSFNGRKVSSAVGAGFLIQEVHLLLPSEVTSGCRGCCVVAWWSLRVHNLYFFTWEDRLLKGSPSRGLPCSADCDATLFIPASHFSGESVGLSFRLRTDRVPVSAKGKKAEHLDQRCFPFQLLSGS